MKKKLQNLVKASYVDGQLDKEIVELIATRLSREDLKKYIQLLKHEENKKHISVTSGSELTVQDKKKIESLFSEKAVLYNIEPSMISGIKVVENDMEYEINLDKKFHDIILFLSKND